MYCPLGSIRKGMELNPLALAVLRFQGGHSCPLKQRDAGLKKVVAIRECGQDFRLRCERGTPICCFDNCADVRLELQ
jgi:hypothetical protein